MPHLVRRSPPRLLAVLALLIAAVAASAATVPLREGLVVVSAVSRPSGDEEHVSRVTAVDAAQVTTQVEFRIAGRQGVTVEERTRRVRRVDLADSTRVNAVFQPGDAELFPGATLDHLSASTLAALKRDGQAPFVLGTLADLGEADWQFSPSGRKYFRGTLKRLSGGPATLDVLVNGKLTALPVVRAAGTLAVGADKVDVEIWVLDDPANPLRLMSRHGRNRGQVVRIDWPGPQPQVSVLEQALAGGDCRAALDGLYFPTGSAQLLPGSRPALAAATQLLQKHPDWRLAIEGHTDNVGGPAYNLDLSRRRAVAVREALTAQRIAPARLSADGFGLTRPVAANTTPEGRAANRRVELVRQCH